MRVRTVLIGVAAVALLLAVWVGARRRAERFRRLSTAYSRVAGSQEHGLIGASLSGPEVDRILSRVHCNDAVASEYDAASRSVWPGGGPNPFKIQCRCGGCLPGMVPRYTPGSGDLLTGQAPTDLP